MCHIPRSAFVIAIESNFLFRGNLSATALWVTYSATQFGCYQSVNRYVWSYEMKARHPDVVSVINGALCGVAATVVTYPLDLFRTAFATQGFPRRFTTMTALSKHLSQSQGFRGYYSGIVPAILQVAPYMGISFGVYSSLSRLRSDQQRVESGQSVVEQLFSYIGCGAAAGLISKLAVYPLDTIKKRIQVEGLSLKPVHKKLSRYNTTWRCAKLLFRAEGVPGFYKGIIPTLMKSIITQSATFASYEMSLGIITRIQRMTIP